MNKCRQLTGLIFAVSLGCCGWGKSMKFDKIEYLITGTSTTPTVLTVEASGVARYESPTNETTPGFPEIGTYQTTLPAAEVQSLGTVLDTPPFQDLPDHWGKVRSGERSRRIRVVTGSATSEKFIGFSEAIAPTMLRVISALDQTVAKVRTHPHKTLRIQVAEVAVGPDRGLTAVLTLSNTGTMPTICRTPPGMIAGEGCQLVVQAWPDKPRSELRPGEVLFAKVAGAEAVQASDTSAAAPCREFAPKAPASFRIRATLEGRNAGAHLVRVIYGNKSPQAGGREVLVGDLFSDAVRVVIPQSAP